MMNELIERIFKENGNIDIDGQAVWDSILRKQGDTGNETIEDMLIINKKRYYVQYYINVNYTYFDENDNEIPECDDFSYVATDVILKSITVQREDGCTDEHTFVYNFN